MISISEAADIALRSLGQSEQQNSALYLLSPETHEPGLIVIARRQRIQINKPSIVVFVDLVPNANWAHPAQYLVVDRETGAMDVVEGELPPPPKDLRLLHRGNAVEPWMLLTEER